MGMTNYPCVPGHELAGVVTAVGRRVTKVKVGLTVCPVPHGNPRWGMLSVWAVSQTAA